MDGSDELFQRPGRVVEKNWSRERSGILANSQIETIFIEGADFLSGFNLYEARPDKGYSLTDCISMSIMRERGIKDVLTHDAHFTQEGFHILL